MAAHAMHSGPWRALLVAVPLVALGGCATTGVESTGNRDVDTLVETQLLRKEVGTLRNQVEVLEHDLAALKKRQKELYADLDRRLRGAGGQTAPGVAANRPGPPSTLGPDLGPETTTAPPQADEQQAYDAAFGILKQGRYGDAIEAFRDFLERFPRSALAGNAQYWIAEALYVTRDFKSALVEYNKVLQQYPENAKVPEAMLKVGYSHFELGQDGEAKSVLNELISRYPNTQVAISAERRLQRSKP